MPRARPLAEEDRPASRAVAASSGSGQEELLALTALRGVAALWVLLYHLRHSLHDLFPEAWPWVKRVSLSGTFGVDLFFVLSGFVIALTSHHRVRTMAGYRDFLVRRLARIYPAYLAAHLAFALYVGWRMLRGAPPLERCATDAASFVTHLLMIQAWTFPIGRAWNLVDWSVSAEWLVYILFPAFAWVSRQRDMWLVAAGSALLAGAALAEVGDSTNMELGLPRVLYGFGMGVVVHRLYLWRGAPGVGWGGLAMVVLAASAAQASKPDAVVEPIAWAPVAFAGVVYFLARSSWSVPRPMRWLGHISYALYLSHSLTLLLFEDAVRPPGEGASIVLRLGYAAAQIGVALAVGHLLYAGVERPARPRVLAMLERGRGQAPRPSG